MQESTAAHTTHKTEMTPISDHIPNLTKHKHVHQNQNCCQSQTKLQITVKMKLTLSKTVWAGRFALGTQKSATVHTKQNDDFFGKTIVTTHTKPLIALWRGDTCPNCIFHPDQPERSLLLSTVRDPHPGQL